MANNLSSRALSLVHHGIARWWVHPLENRVIPWLESGRQTRFRSAILRWAAWCANVGRILVLELRVNVQRWVGSRWSVTYIGDGTSTEYLSSIMFPNEHTVVELPRVFLWQVPALVQKYTGEGDLVVCELNEIARWSLSDVNTFFVVPLWIKQVLEEIDRPMEDILASINRTTRKNIRRLEKQDFSLVLTHKKEDFDLFYYRMYLPHITSRHKGRGMILDEYELLRKIFISGGLLLIKDGQNPVCGALHYMDGNTCVIRQGGVLDADFELVKRGVKIAQSWFMIQWAHNQGIQRIDFGSSRAQASDGVFQFKRHMGTRVVSHKYIYTQWGFYGQSLPENLRNHLNIQRMITVVDRKFHLVLLSDSNDSTSSVDIARELKFASACGLSGLVVINENGERRVISHST